MRGRVAPEVGAPPAAKRRGGESGDPTPDRRRIGRGQEEGLKTGPVPRAQTLVDAIDGGVVDEKPVNP